MNKPLNDTDEFEDKCDTCKYARRPFYDGHPCEHCTGNSKWVPIMLLVGEDD